MIKNSLFLTFHSSTNLTFYYCLIVRGWRPQVCKGHRSVPVFALSVVPLDFVFWSWIAMQLLGRRRSHFCPDSDLASGLSGEPPVGGGGDHLKDMLAFDEWGLCQEGHPSDPLPLERKRRLATEAKSQSVLGWQGRETPPHPAASGNVQCEVFSDFL